MNLIKNGDFAALWADNHNALICKQDGTMEMSIADNIFVPLGWDAAWYLHGMPVEQTEEPYQDSIGKE